MSLSGGVRRNLIVTIGLGMLLLSPALASKSSAQDQSQLVDYIVAVIGDTMILRSELEEYILDLQAQRIPVPPPESPERPAFLEQVLDRMVADLLIIVAAQKADIIVGDDEVDQLVDQQLAAIRRQFASQLQFEQALAGRGLTLVEFRLRLTQRGRAQIMAQRYLEREVSMINPIPVSEEEIEEVWEVQKSTLGPKPASVTLKQVIISTEPTDDAGLLAREEAEQALSRAIAGEDFTRLAREYSDDAASRESGGDLGWVQRGLLVPEFEEALWAMRPGEISDIVETGFGYHIIKLERVRGDDRQARHILIRPEVLDADIEMARQLADSVAAGLRAGADVDSMIQAYGDPNERSTLTQFPQEQLPELYRRALANAQPGDAVGPIELRQPGMPPKWAVVVLIDLSPAGEWELNDYREVIRQQLQQQAMIQKVVDGLREQTYVELRLEG